MDKTNIANDTYLCYNPMTNNTYMYNQIHDSYVLLLGWSIASYVVSLNDE
ncbi:hypothetical protein KDI_23620 [Dictyobacter arantiisoli]|uniref:Uncharacterized protein n=1 Tax=Dictyobacter arantiisoli TaxID=2014874 RepID=A0A5A5TBN0_9CHLR|nr:hypothetical protein KDI_23620 [Dictyobacter arantiisoli]